MKKKVEQEQEKRGRGRPPVEHPLIHDVKVRFDDVTFQKLEKYCKKHKTTKTEIIRDLIADFLSKKK